MKHYENFLKKKILLQPSGNICTKNKHAIKHANATMKKKTKIGVKKGLTDPWRSVSTSPHLKIAPSSVHAEMYRWVGVVDPQLLLVVEAFSLPVLVASLKKGEEKGT